jgi:hypothetical protein
MARAHSIWVVVEGGVPRAAFTVKHELMAWLRRYSFETRMDWRYYKIRDGLYSDSQAMIRVDPEELGIT